MNKWWWLGGLVAILLVVVYKPASLPKLPLEKSEDVSKESVYALPTDGFLDRISLKPFGIYIDPKNSPVQPERFRGYHTAVDAEYGDVETDVEVRAIADGVVVVSRTATGYGGVMVLDHRPEHGFYSLYGHIDPTSMAKVGTVVKKGEVIGKLAPAFSNASGGERKHLHFGIIKSAQPTIAGYVQNESELSAWMDPLELWNSD